MSKRGDPDEKVARRNCRLHFEPHNETGSEQARARVTPLGVLQRMVSALVLIPVVFATALIGSTWCEALLKAFGLDELRSFHLLFSVLMVVCSVVVWRSVIVWTLGRRTLTCVIGLIPFAQVIYGQPLWNAGCGTDDVLRVGQEQCSIGIWMWLMIWVWWGWERFDVGTKAHRAVVRRLRMTQNIKSVVASIGTLPFSVGAFFIIGSVFDDLIGVSRPQVFTLAYAFAAIVAVAAWLVVWWGRVGWTNEAAWRTFFSAVLLLLLPIAATYWADPFSGAAETTVMLLPVLGWGLWMASTMWIWPLDTAQTALSEEGPVCLKCGYLLKGLTKTRCPECGAEPTLDELWAASLADVH